MLCFILILSNKCVEQVLDVTFYLLYFKILYLNWFGCFLFILEYKKYKSSWNMCELINPFLSLIFLSIQFHFVWCPQNYMWMHSVPSRVSKVFHYVFIYISSLIDNILLCWPQFNKIETDLNNLNTTKALGNMFILYRYL